MEPSTLAGIPYPPAPWRLGGRALIAPLHVDRELAVPEGFASLGAGRTVVLALNRYTRGPLQYDELALAIPVRRGLLPMLWVPWLWVSSRESAAGGRRIWGLRKILAQFDGDDERMAISDEDGPLLTLHIVRDGLPLPPLAGVLPALGELGGNPRPFTVRGWARPRLAHVDITDWSLRFPFSPRLRSRAYWLERFGVTVAAPRPEEASGISRWLLGPPPRHA